MPVLYTGNEANVSATRDDVSATLPVDGDPRNAASVNGGTQRVLDFLQRVRKKAGFLDLASSWSALQTFVGGIAVTGPATFSQVTSTSSVTGTSFTFGSPQALATYVSAMEFRATRDVAGIDGGGASLPNGVAVVVGDTGSTTWYVRPRLPIGAVVTGIDVLSRNTYSPGNNQDIAVTVARYDVASNGTVTRTYLNAGGGGGDTLTIPGTSTGSQPGWYAIPLIGSPGAQPAEGFIELGLSHPPQASGSVALATYAVRFRYTLAALAPA
ncbi:hypothetical protein [Myxococcus phage Mx4 ts27htf-1hrm-1]|nr:hypothetical protein Mx4_p67 [Myxococcus phage Mx4]WNM70405.1 hypothetical protein [Myxococcus phage Mx4 ts27htf-1hrm-1]